MMHLPLHVQNIMPKQGAQAMVRFGNQENPSQPQVDGQDQSSFSQSQPLDPMDLLTLVKTATAHPCPGIIGGLTAYPQHFRKLPEGTSREEVAYIGLIKPEFRRVLDKLVAQGEFKLLEKGVERVSLFHKKPWELYEHQGQKVLVEQIGEIKPV